MTTTTVRFREGAGRVCLDFIRTLRYRGTPDATEELPDGAAVAAWVRQCGPCPLDVASESADAGRARELREAVHALIIAAVRTGDPAACGDDARHRVNRAAAAPVPVPALDASGRIRWAADDPVTATLALIARDALDLVTSAAVTRVRECADPRCGALFLDQSRPGTRRWCSMDTCGNRAKKTTLRARRSGSQAAVTEV
ncbi:CGNR zinc finger domain-containing protein [Actinoallomurus rhizosphaericola]|uniref:CGNR zinc finger domain-containing protein n=1 Tax=Actinoallomurus rhizosphaericola TaxID=2952536 RepID=UPI002092B756|nr:ABATE domain-containing protein [Actinoallomurus rhizosphaericola]MCO5995022.1 ABATE domain-containing protein [Actinoallomurus rhizosphaericola]